MPILLGTGDFGNKLDIEFRNGLTTDLTTKRSNMTDSIETSDDSVEVQASGFATSCYFVHANRLSLQLALGSFRPSFCVQKASYVGVLLLYMMPMLRRSSFV